MRLKVDAAVTHVTGGPFGPVHFVFNTRAGSWAAMRKEAYDFLQVAVQTDRDPMGIGLEMGFSREELCQFLSYLGELSILANGGGGGEQSRGFLLQKCYFHVDQACNLKCPTCYSWRAGRNSRKHELSTELVGEALRQMKELGLTELVISGGEPLIRHDLVDILLLAKEVHQIETVILLTNGTLVTPQIARGVADYVDVVSVSIDGPNEEQNAQIRGKGSFSAAVRGIKEFQAAAVRMVNILPTVTHQNVHQLDGFRALAENLGTSISFSMFLAVGSGSQPEVLRELALTPSDMAYLAEAIAAAGSIDQQMIVMEPCAVGLRATDGCGMGRDLISIDFDGTVYPCHMSMRPDLKMGKFPEQPLHEILSRSPLALSLRDFHVDQYHGCGQCSIRYFCGGGCRANALAAANDLRAHDPACAFYLPALSRMLEPIILAANPAES